MVVDIYVRLRELLAHLLDRVSRKRSFPVQELIEQNPQTPDICLRRVSPIENDFRWHVLVSSGDARADLFGVVQQHRPAKVAEFDAEVFIQQQVLGLDVSMNQILLMQEFDRKGSLVEKSEGQPFGQPVFRVDVEKQTAFRRQLQ